MKKKPEEKKRLRIAVLFICLNEPYWQYAKDVIESADKFLLKNHDVSYFLWSDMPEGITYGATVFPTEPVQWPLPTLFRYHLFLQQEEILKGYDYIFYSDCDMLYVDHVGDEILGEGLTAALHPMYAVRQQFRPPFEPNPQSSAYIHVPDNYYAGGFQGGKSDAFIRAMWSMRRTIDADFVNNYVARWNDESHWNRYLYDNPPSVVLSPSYIYPDSLIDEYYVKVWGKNYPPKLVTLTKKFSVSKEGGDAIKRNLETL